ncbi:MAG: SPASM domain-containing protein [Nitrospirota bacterium]
METNLEAIRLELTNKCQLSCAECSRRFMSRPVGEMDFELAKLIVEEGLEYKKDISFILSGLGEPLLYKRLPELIDFMAEKGVAHLNLFTNLSMKIKPSEVGDVFKAINKSKINVNLIMSLHLYDENGQIQSVVKNNFDENFDIAMELLQDNKRVDKHITVVDTKYHTDEDTSLYRYRKYLIPENIQVARQLNPWFDLVKDMAGKEGHSPGSIAPSICEHPFILLYAGWDGQVLICCTDGVNGECTLGEIKEKGDLKRIWEGDKLNQIRKEFNEYKITIQPCKKCYKTLFARKSLFLKNKDYKGLREQYEGNEFITN